MGTQFQKTALAIVAILVVGYLGYRLYMGQGLTGGDDQSPNSPATVSSTPLGGGAARTPTPQPTQASGAAATVMTAINARRTSEKVAALPANAILQREAQRLADDMAKNGYLDHTDSTGATFTERMAASGYASGNVAENIGITSGTSGTDVVSNWMISSTGHRESMLDPKHRAIGVGVATGTYQGQSAIFVVAIFGDLK
jgi:uncharacterized protein YkwD